MFTSGSGLSWSTSTERPKRSNFRMYIGLGIKSVLRPFWPVYFSLLVLCQKDESSELITDEKKDYGLDLDML